LIDIDGCLDLTDLLGDMVSLGTGRQRRQLRLQVLNVLYDTLRKALVCLKRRRFNMRCSFP